MPTLTTPITINHLTLPNRLVMPPMATHKSPDGSITDAHIEYYRERTAGDSVGLLITEHSYIDVSGRADPKQIGIDSDEKMEGFQKLTDAIHEAGGTKVFCQINHAGNMTQAKVTGTEIVSSSDVVTPTGRSREVPRPLTVSEIETLIQKFTDAAVRAKKAGYDGVEIHAAHGYLLDQFYSPLTNKRTDAYGGSLDNRIRFHLSVIRSVREAVGKDYPVAIRFGGCDYMEGGATIEDAVYAAGKFEEAGADLIDISGGMCLYTLKGRTQAGYFSDLSSAVREAVNVPVILTGGVKTGEEAEALLQEGAADLIGAGRVMMRDAHWAQNVLAG